jgi:glycosyltransferase involved in cell wall biosynthesis
VPSNGSERPVAMLTHSYYDEDPRVRREAEALVACGRPVDVFALRQPGAPALDEVAGVRVHRLGVQRHQGAGLATYLREYLSFLARASWAVTRHHWRRHYAIVQVHTLPDFLVFAGLPLKVVGVPLILDMHEAMPEFFRTRFPRASNRVVHWLVRAQERASIRVSNATLTVNDALRDRLLAAGVPADKVTVIENSPSLKLFDSDAHAHRGFAEDGIVRLVYAGALSPIYELNVALAALGQLAIVRPDLAVTLDIYGRDFGESALVAEAQRLGLADRVTFHGRVPLEEVPDAIARADIGLAPTRQDRFTDFSLSTKVFEYAAMGKPVIASRLPMVERVFGNDAVAMYTPGDPADLARQVIRLADDRPWREARVDRTGTLIRHHTWEREAERYRAIVDRLANDRTAEDDRPDQPGL